MKIGIMTAHCSCNPGASLQAHAVYKAVSDLGHEPYIIDYRPRYFTDIAEKSFRGDLHGKDHIKMALLGRRLKKRYDRFSQFEANYYPNKTRCYQTHDDLVQNVPVLDGYLCGSDQIWNPQHIHYDGSFFFDFVNGHGQPVISYAASIGQDTLHDKDIQFLKDNLGNFSALSVREDSAVHLLKEMGFPCVQHVDPTLLFSADYWRGISTASPVQTPDHYILYYPLQHNPLELALIQAMKEKFKLPCVAIESALRATKGVDIQIPYYSPNEYLWLIDHADYVITNSFHGCLFSVLFEKCIVPFKNQYRNCRLESLFRLLELDGIQVDSVEDFHTKCWDKYWCKGLNTIRIVEREKQKAFGYLRRAIHDH